MEFMLWVAKQKTLAEKVFTCYEAGPFGYSLHRKLEKMGVANYVVRPRDWDEYGPARRDQDRQTGRQGTGATPGPLRQRQPRRVLCGPGTQPGTRAGAEHLAAAGKFSAGAAAPGRAGTQPRPLLRRAYSRRMVAGRSLENLGRAVAGDRGEAAGTAAPADWRD